jgi:DNA-binding winged helix-turn-helix (wHTH) protein/TolB-like protein
MSELSTLSHGFQLGPYCVRPRQEQIQGPERTYHLEPKVMQVLVTLAEHALQPVSRDQLLETVWAGTVVGDEVVSRAISLLRGYLQDERKNPRFIRTIPKTGYELIHPISPLEPELPIGPPAGGPHTSTTQDAASGSQLPVASAFGYRHLRLWAAGLSLLLLTAWSLLSVREGAMESATVAVLPFKINGDAEALSYIREGLADYLINRLSQARNLHVVAKRSSFANFDATIDARGLGSLLGADYIIDGTLSDGPSARLNATVYLVETESGTNRASAQVAWANTDIPGLQQATFESALDALGKVLRVRFDVEVQPPERVNQAAYRAYLEAKYQWSLRGEARIGRAIELLREAIQAEPGFAEGHLALAQALAIEPFYTNQSVDAGFAAARVYAAQASRLNPELKPDADALEGFMLKQEWRWQEALDRLEQALRADPESLMAHYWYSTLLSSLGRFEDALVHIKWAQRQDPISPFINDRLAVAYMWRGNMEAAAERYQVATRLGYLESIQPKSFFVFLKRTERYDELGELLLRQGYDANWVEPFIDALRHPARRSSATRVLEAAIAREEIPLELRFGIWTFLGDANRALASFELDPKTPDIEYLWAEETAFLRNHPDFPALLEKLNLAYLIPRA